MDKQTFLAEIHTTHEPVAAAVARLSDDAWADPIPGMDTLAIAVAWDSSKHYPEHLPHLMA